MKTLFKVLFGLFLAGFALAEENSSIGSPKRTPEELEKLVAPIALYPDALVAVILPASTFSADIVLAARYLAANPNNSEIDAQSWDESVKSLARYPELVKWMDENLEWTRELGEAFVAQPAEVMTTVQKLRTKAQASGVLKDTPEQRVVVREEQILILPARSDVIYIPSYDPRILYVDGYYRSSPSLSFSIGFLAGSWLYYDCDWPRYRVSVYHRPPGWVYRPDWRWHRPEVHTQCVPWTPNPHYWNHERRHHYSHRDVPHVPPPRFDGRDRDYHRSSRFGGGVVTVRPAPVAPPPGNSTLTRPNRDVRDGRDGRTWDNNSRSGHMGGSPNRRDEPGRRDRSRGDSGSNLAPAPTPPAVSAPPSEVTSQRPTVVRSRIPYRVPSESTLNREPPTVSVPRTPEPSRVDRSSAHRVTRQVEASNFTPPAPPQYERSHPVTRHEVSRPVEVRSEPVRSSPPPPPPSPPPAASSSDSSNSSSSSGGGYERSGRFGGGTVR